MTATTAGLGAAAPAAASQEKARRFQSLDLLRGLTVAGMILVNATDAMHLSGHPVFPVLLHADWAGFTAADAVFPAFITMVGVSIAISARPGAASLPAAKILWRALRLVLLGLFLGNLYQLLAPPHWPPRLTGVLQRIGAVYAVAAYIYPRTSLKTRAIAAAATLLAYWGLCVAPLPDGSHVDLWAQGRNLPSWLDRRVFGAWAYVKGPNGYDPEGLLSTFPAIAQALIGTVAGDLLRRNIPVRKLSLGFAAAGAAGVMLALAWNIVLPIAKNIWTSSFVLLSAGVTLVGLAAFHAIFDGKAAPARRGGLLGSFGRNAISAYALHYLLITVLLAKPLQAPYSLLAPLVGPQWAALAPVAIFMAIVWAPLAVMDWRRWYLKI